MSTADTPAELASPERGRMTEIFVNARPHLVADKAVSFEEVVALAFPGQEPAPDTEYIVTYTRAQHGNGSGSLAPGQEVRVKKGTSFSVQITTRS
ncbi:multiubiquitin domain-containing protein [Cellulomonas fimi]|uniref:Multi-ubiquitin domain-containing protein n=1 Tax=Cellulomonas fimi (strain ATCC 484 / DSM 20113 / JCM 1341 / CCUG 24087 / LMG 16345 / NBRC 15513 / NCIMB 8980 / NCTC 7547 / NRS-133) TaxID=590998 RepID=F4GZU7_CELFA|nr:multiubiquitin domain-containing protein [Cellulomonas fimi]AEE47263.1 hypothetical protein Celf_3149 [Cellulomonas fimi ATCC 484]NNH06978.1 hypothetical protein [Cellulomonas fimi]VEH35753.1 Uncharacterised protein [Cellulomonas fimi]